MSKQITAKTQSRARTREIRACERCCDGSAPKARASIAVDNPVERRIDMTRRANPQDKNRATLF